nr:SDR family NAD(P)-dependent oxidoreductase [Sulfitobacter faviae]
MSTRFAGKVMVVTGAAQGIGRSVAERAAAEGARVLIVDRSPARKEVVKAIRSAGGEAEAISVNLETWSGCEKAMQKAVDLWGQIDILINNVGGTIWAKPYEHYEPKQIEAEVRRSLSRPCFAAAQRLTTCCTARAA